MDDIFCWLSNSMNRIFKHTKALKNKYLRIDLACNDRGSFQASVCKTSGDMDKINVCVNSPEGLDVRGRRVGHVPVPRFNTETDYAELEGVRPGYVPDPLYDDLELFLQRNQVETYWISIITDENTSPGIYPVDITFKLNDKTVNYPLKASVHVHPVVLKHRTKFPVTHWFCADALCDWYKVEPFNDEFWKVVKPYMENLTTHGVNVAHTPLFTPPTDGIRGPHQLLRISKTSDDVYSFNWTDVKKWIALARACGFQYFEWTHLFSQWGAKFGIPVYENYDGNYWGRMLWPRDTSANSDTYKKFLSQFLPEFKRFLEQEDLLDKSFFHLSDEPNKERDLENYKIARNILKDMAPWMKVMDALSDIEFAQEGLTDIPAASINHSLEFADAGISRWDYFCCGPRGDYLNRLMDTPLAKIRGAGWLFYKFQSLAFLHWGYNYWYKSQTNELIDPFTVSDGLAWPNWAYGDPFVVYPGTKGPVDSIRWEIFSESLKDYALLQRVELDINSSILQPFLSYEDFPKEGSWYEKARALLLHEASHT